MHTARSSPSFRLLHPSCASSEFNSLICITYTDYRRDNSPYPEVRAVVSNTDDPTLPCSTIRAWVIGLIFTAGGSACNQFFSPRQPAISLSVYVAQVLAFPIGKAWEKFMPNLFSIPIPFSGGQRMELNPGPFTQKEHMLITYANADSWSLSPDKSPGLWQTSRSVRCTREFARDVY